MLLGPVRVALLVRGAEPGASALRAGDTPLGLCLDPLPAAPSACTGVSAGWGFHHVGRQC